MDSSAPGLYHYPTKIDPRCRYFHIGWYLLGCLGPAVLCPEKEFPENPDLKFPGFISIFTTLDGRRG